jgi:glycosyltransferase involved in cell wall biosynthesis
MHQPKLSIVITLFNEEDNVNPLLQKLYQALEGYEYEIILVDDGSTDQTIEMIKLFANERVRLLVFYKNYGQTSAMAAGIEQAQGEYIVTMDGDLQNDPTDIPMMLAKLEEEGWDVVAGRRAKRQDGLVLRKIPSKIANAIIRKLTGVYLNDYGCTLKIFKYKIAKNLGLYGQLHRFVPVLAKLHGAKITEVDVKHHARIHGQSKYGLGRTFRVMSDLLLMIFFQKYLQQPMHLFGAAGILAFLIGVLVNFYLLVVKLFGQDIGGRPLLVLGAMLIIAGIQLVTFGIIVELLMRVYFESQNKKPYNIKEIYIGQARTEKAY